MSGKQTKKKQKKKRNQNNQNNREYSFVLYLFTGLFVMLIGYVSMFQITKSREVINNPYNARLEAFENKVIRGSILASDGQQLAYTEVDQNGTETRKYPFGCTFSHVLGYSDYGKTGIEELGNFQLITSNAYFMERFFNELKEQKNVGDSLVTTLDVDLQTAAHDALSKRNGAVIVMEPSTGNIRAMVSKPDYDPSEVASKWETFSSSDDGILLNRATQGLYPPGSVFKTVTLLEYLREHQMDPTGFSYTCKGKISTGDRNISCYHGKSHGELDLKSAFAKSCNSAFAQIGSELNVDSYEQLADQLLFNQDLPLSFPYSKSSFALKDTDTETTKMLTAIGQGDTLVTPMHLAMLMSAIANDGVLMTPRVLDRTENYTGKLVERYEPQEYGSLLTSEEAENLKEYLRAVVTDGTGSALQTDSYTVYGKTGTAEYSNNKKSSHAWFVGWASGDKEDLVVAVLVEKVGSGSEYAVPIAKRIFDTYYGK